MVLPLIIGAGAFITFGKDLLGEKLFKVGILVIVSGVLYVGYKAYEGYKKVTDDPVGAAVDIIKKAKEEAGYVSAASLSALLGGGTSREGHQKVEDIFKNSEQVPFTVEEVGLIQSITSHLPGGAKKYVLTDCDKLVEGNEMFMSDEDIDKKHACEEAGYKKTLFKYW